MSFDFQVKTALRESVNPRVFFWAESGAGKTYTSLMLANQIVNSAGDGRGILFIDTENGSAIRYARPSEDAPVQAGEWAFDAVDISAPFSLDKAVALMEWASTPEMQRKYGVLVIDSISHFWNAEGGALEEVSSLAKTQRYNQYTAWGPVGAKYNRLLQKIINFPYALIVCARAKEDHVQTIDSRGKATIERVGLGAIFKGEFLYEFDIAGTLHAPLGELPTLSLEKSRFSGLHGAVVSPPTEEFFQPFLDWMKGGVDRTQRYGNGETVPSNPETQSWFIRYVGEHNGTIPANGEQLAAWVKKQPEYTQRAQESS